ncbi:MAG: serine/threonine-protein kinase, partial [Planctomycetota bacterium]
MAHRYRGRRRPRRRIPPSGKPPTPQGRTSGRQPAGAVAPAAPAAKQKDPLIGRTLGRCTIEAAIGQGRTSRVYRAHHQGLDATVAVKVLLPDAAAKPRVVESFMREARALAKIDNENVLKIYDVASEGDVHYIVMELLDGEEVLDLIRREERIDVMDALRIVRQAANGLATAHAQHIIHRDVKPQNLVLLEDGTVKVVDFGLAVAAGDEGSRVGTPHYMAPEVCKAGQAEVGSDVYALGIVL